MKDKIPPKYRKPDNPKKGDEWITYIESEDIFGIVICHSPNSAKPSSWNGGPFDTLHEAKEYIDNQSKSNRD